MSTREANWPDIVLWAERHGYTPADVEDWSISGSYMAVTVKFKDGRTDVVTYKELFGGDDE